MEKLNIAEILKDCPEGTKLYSPIFGEVELEKVFYTSIIVKGKSGISADFYIDGKYHSNGECMLFPSKENRDWSTFQRPFKDGDVVTWEDRGSLVACIYKERKNTASFNHYIALYKGGLGIVVNGEIALTDDELCLATEEEKEKLFDAIKANGYKWDDETKTLEKLIEPKFKVGDRIRYAGEDFAVKIIDIKNNQYHIEYFCDKYNDYKNGIIPVSEQNNYMLIPKFDITTLKAFDKVLVRCNSLEKWHIQFFEKYNTELGAKYPFICLCNSKYCQCIPYEGNEHLLGTTNNCNDYYKTWE